MYEITIFISFFLIILTVQPIKVYISPEKGCSKNCKGDIIEPFDNLWAVLDQQTANKEYEYILLHSPQQNHYIMTKEETPNSNDYVSLPETIELKSNTIIRPLFCDEEEVVNNTELSNRCIPRTDKITIFMKTESLSIVSSSALALQNVVLSGFEDISKYNSPSEIVNKCLYNRMRCCDKSAPNSSLYAEVKCSGKVSTPLNLTRNGFLILKSNQKSTPALTIASSSFEDINFISTKSLISAEGSTPITLQSVQLIHTKLPRGLISYSVPDPQDDQPTELSIEDITIEGLSLQNDRLFSINGVDKVTISGIKITESSFTNSSQLINLNDIDHLKISSLEATNNQLIGTNLLKIANSEDVQIIDTIFSQNSASGAFLSLESAEVNFQNAEIRENNFTNQAMVFEVLKSSNLFSEGLETHHNNFNISSRFFLISDMSLVKFEDSNLKHSNFDNASKMFDLDEDAQIAIFNTTVQEAFFSPDSYLIIAHDGNIVITDSDFLDVQKIDTQNQTQVTGESLFLGILNASRLSIGNADIIRSSSLFRVLDAAVDFTKVRIREVFPFSNSRQVLSVQNSEVKIQGLRINFAGITETSPWTDKWISGVSSTFEVDQLLIQNAVGNEGHVFDLVESNLNLTNSKVRETYTLNEGSVFLKIQGGQFININTMEVRDVKGLLYIDEVLEVNLSDITVRSSNPVKSFIDIRGAVDVNFNQSTFNLTKANLSPARSFVYLQNIEHSINVANSSFSNIHSRNGSLHLFFNGTKPTTKLDSLIFENNVALGGLSAGISIQGASGVSVLVNNCTFHGNKATRSEGQGGYGGAMYLSASLQEKPSIVIKSCDFTKNFATVSGGAIYTADYPPELPTFSNFYRNKAGIYDSDIASPPVKMTAYHTTYEDFDISTTFDPDYTQNLHLSIKDVASGQVLPEKYKFILIDLYGNVPLNDDYSILNISSSNPELIPVVNSIKASHGTFDLSSVIFKYKPSTDTVKITLKSDNIIQYPEENPSIGMNNNNYTVELTFRYCVHGEGWEKDNTCKVCPPGQKADTINGVLGPCEACNPEAMICNGPEEIAPQEGYWRLNASANIFVECPLKEACLGGRTADGETIATGRCKVGYQGNLCATCMEGWGKDIDGRKCINCDKNIGTYLAIPAVIILTSVLLAISTRSTIHQSKIATRSDEEKSNDYNKTILLRFLMNFLQIISILGTINAQWPGAVSTLLNINRTLMFTTSTVLGLDCLLPKMGVDTDTPTPFVNLVAFNLIPLFFAVMALVFWAVYYRIIRRAERRGNAFSRSVIITFTILGLIFQPTVIQEDMKMFQCKNIYRKDKPLYALQGDYNVECWGPQHNAWTFGLGLPSLIIWAIILPVILFLRLRKYRFSLDEERIKSNFSFLYKGYKYKKYYWEFVIMLEKYLLITAITLGSINSAKLQAYLFCTVLVVAFCLQYKYKPYVNNPLNNFEKLSLICMVIICVSGIYFSSKTESSFERIIFIVLAFLAYLGFFAAFAWCYYMIGKTMPKQSKNVKAPSLTNFREEPHRRFPNVFNILFGKHKGNGDDDDSKGSDEQQEEQEIQIKNNYGTTSEAKNLRFMGSGISESFHFGRTHEDEFGISPELNLSSPAIFEKKRRHEFKRLRESEHVNTPELKSKLQPTRKESDRDDIILFTNDDRSEINTNDMDQITERFNRLEMDQEHQDQQITNPVLAIADVVVERPEEDETSYVLEKKSRAHEEILSNHDDHPSRNELSQEEIAPQRQSSYEDKTEKEEEEKQKSPETPKH